MALTSVQPLCIKVRVGIDGNARRLPGNIIWPGNPSTGAAPFEGHDEKRYRPSFRGRVADSPYLSSIPDHYVGLHSPKYQLPVLWYTFSRAYPYRYSNGMYDR